MAIPVTFGDSAIPRTSVFPCSPEGWTLAGVLTVSGEVETSSLSLKLTISEEIVRKSSFLGIASKTSATKETTAQAVQSFSRTRPHVTAVILRDSCGNRHDMSKDLFDKLVEGASENILKIVGGGSRWPIQTSSHCPAGKHDFAWSGAFSFSLDSIHHLRIIGDPLIGGPGSEIIMRKNEIEKNSVESNLGNAAFRVEGPVAQCSICGAVIHPLSPHTASFKKLQREFPDFLISKIANILDSS